MPIGTPRTRAPANPYSVFLKVSQKLTNTQPGVHAAGGVADDEAPHPLGHLVGTRDQFELGGLVEAREPPQPRSNVSAPSSEYPRAFHLFLAAFFATSTASVGFAGADLRATSAETDN